MGLIDYHEQHAYAYNLFGLEDKRNDEIGAAKRGTSMAAQQDYIEKISKVLGKAVCSMPSGGKLIVVAGDKYNLYGKIAEKIGVKQIAEIKRHVNRRTGRRTIEFYESVFVWEKTGQQNKQ